MEFGGILHWAVGGDAMSCTVDMDDESVASCPLAGAERNPCDRGTVEGPA